MFDGELEWMVGEGDMERQVNFQCPIPSPLLSFDCPSPLAIKIKDSRYNFHQEITEHLLSNLRLLCRLQKC